MAKLKDTVRWRDMSGGIIQKVSSDVAITNSIPFSMNLEFDKVLGEATIRKGTSRIGSQLSAGNSALGLFQHIDSTFSNSVLMADFNGTIYNVVTGATLASSLSSSAKARFATYMNTTLMLNGSQSRAYTSAAGFVSTGGALDVGDVPAGGQFPVEFKDRMYCAVKDQLYYTSTPTGGAVTWDGAGSGSLQAEQEDGGGTIQGLNKVPGYLMIYKQRSLKRWNFDSSFPEDLVNIGTQSQESVVRARGQNFFSYMPNGFYKTNGSYPVLISRPIQRFVDAIPSSFYANINGWSDNNNIYWSIGDITLDFDRGYTETHNNVVLRYTIDQNQWAAFKYAHEFRQLTQYISGTDVLIVGGDTDGQVLQINTGTTDYGSVPITYILQSPEFDFTTRDHLKTINEKIIVHSDLTEGAELQKRLDYGIWESCGKINDIVTEVNVADQNLTSHIFEFRIVDSATGGLVKLRGLDFPNVEIHSNIS